MTWTEFDVDGVPYRRDDATGEVQRWTVAYDGRYQWLPIEAGQTAMARREPAPVEVRRIEPPMAPVRTVQQVQTSRTDQAWGFSIKTTLLGAATALALVTIKYGILGHPVILAAAAGWIFGTYALVWLIAFIIDIAISPDGVSWMHTRELWRYYRAEQRHRHRQERDR